MATLTAGKRMAKAKGERPKYVPAKIGAEAARLAKIAASFKDLSMAEYVTQVVEAAARRDIDAEHAKMKRGQVDE